MIHRSICVLAAAFAAFLGDAAPAAAQEAAPQQPAELRGIEEIVVTARRKVESQQDVPVSVTALTGDELSFNTVQDVQDIEKSVAGIQIRVFGARTSTAAITMRGQTAGSDVATVDGAVGVYINEVYVGKEKGLNQALFDIDNVQVLRGPQGTLFGRNTTGGALLINTRMPEEDFGGYLKAFAGDYSRYGGEGALNLPISETLKARAAFTVTRRNGYSPTCVSFSPPGTIAGPCPGKRQDVDDENSNGWRLSLLWEPTEFFSSSLVTDGNIQNTNGTSSFLANVNPSGLANTLTGGAFVLFEQQTKDRLDDRWSASERKQRGQIKSYGLTSTSTVDLETATAKMILGYRHVQVEEFFDLDGTGFNFLWTEQDFDQDQFSAELLVNGSAAAERIEWTGGLYFFEENGRDGSFSPIIFFSPPFTHFDADFNHRAYSAYVSTVLHFTEWLSLTTGYRYTVDQREMEARHATFIHTNPALGPESPRARIGCAMFADDLQTTVFPSDACFRDVDEEFDAHTGQVTFQLQPTDNFQAYVTWRRGYRSGGFNLRAQAPGQFAPFRPEHVDDFEVGFKSDFSIGDMPVRANLALFWDLYEEAQRSVIRVTGSGNLQTVILNAADATIKGWELELRMNPVDSLELRLGSAAAVARYDKFIEATAGGGTFDRSDQHFTFQPDYTVNASMRYTLPIANLFGRSSGDIAVQFDWVWYDDTLLSGPQGPGLSDNRQSSYHIVDMRIDWARVLDTPFDVSFWMKNIADKRYGVGAVNFQNSFGFDVLNYGPPRLYGVDFTYHF